MVARGPTGWPRDLPPPGTEEFEAKVAGWLLDRAPADMRASAIRQWPLALAHLLVRVVDAEIEGVRKAYASARSDLGSYLSPDELSSVQAALEAEGARLLQVQREVSLVTQALLPSR